MPMDLERRSRISLSRPRAGALAALLVALVAYGAGAEHLPGLPSGLDVVFHSAIVFPAFAATIWLALPLARTGNRALLVTAVVVGVVAVVPVEVVAVSVTDVTRQVSTLSAPALTVGGVISWVTTTTSEAVHPFTVFVAVTV